MEPNMLHWAQSCEAFLDFQAFGLGSQKKKEQTVACKSDTE